MTVTDPPFEVGPVRMTAAVARWLAEDDARRIAFVLGCLQRHCGCDWGDLNPSDAALNDAAVRDPGSDRIFSSYHLPVVLQNGDSMWGEPPALWVITDGDGTCVLDPGSY